MIKTKLKVHLITLPRWFALPFFCGSALIGSLLAGGSIGGLNTWLGFILVAFLMACGHSQNSYWDWYVGLDRGEDRSAEKTYTGGCGVISQKLVTADEVIFNSTIWFVLSMAVAIILSIRVNSSYIFIPMLVGLFIPVMYTKGKFSWYHETALAMGVTLAAILGMFAVNPSPYWWKGLIVCLPIAVLLSFCGLAIDEYPDAEANLKKGVKSTSYKVWEYGFDLSTYLMLWIVAIYAFQVFLMTINFLNPLSMISFILFPIFLSEVVTLKKASDDFRKTKVVDSFNKVAVKVVLTAAIYPVLILIGQVLG